MVSNFALFNNLLLASVALAVPSSRLRDRFYRGCENSPPQTIKRVESPTGVVFDPELCSNWAGACWRKPKGTFTYVTGAFTVPTPSGDDGSAAIWIGIDGDTCQNILQAGIVAGIQNGEVWYYSWYEWYPEEPVFFSPDAITVKAGHVIRVTVIATSTTSGMVIMENLTVGQFIHVELISAFDLCEMNAEWIVEDFRMNGLLVPFANFGSVTFIDALACDPDANCYPPDGATLYRIMQRDVILTSVSADGNSVTINHV